jgi:microcystin-dependent protein
MTSIFPVSASVGQEFSGYSFDGESWNLIGNEFNPTSFSSSPPLNPKAGDLWVDSDEDVDIIDDQNLVFQNDLNDYLSLSSASSTYLSKTSASTTYATKEYADNSSSVAAAALVDSAPSTLNTLNELAAALGDDPNFATTITNALSPIGSVTAYALPTPPAGWLLCDGSIYSASAYPTLSVGLGSTYGGNGTTTFAVPNLKGRMPVGLDSSQTEFDTRGETGGSKTSVAPHDHSIAHNHDAFNTTDGAGSHSHGLLYAGGSFAMTGASTVGSNVNWFLGNSAFGGTVTVGSSGSHNHNIDVPALTGTSGAASAEATSGNLQPYLVMNYIIRAV